MTDHPGYPPTPGIKAAVARVIAVTEREKLETVAASFTNLMELKDKQRVTSALMIRACVKAIVREPTPFDDVERRRKIVKDRRAALKGLADLADMLDPPPST